MHVRLLPPLVGMSLALTLVFLAAWIDGDLRVREREGWKREASKEVGMVGAVFCGL